MMLGGLAFFFPLSSSHQKIELIVKINSSEF